MSDYGRDQNRFMRELEDRQEYIEQEAQARASLSRIEELANYLEHVKSHTDRARRHLKNGGLSGDFGPELEDAINCEVMRRMAEILSEPAQAVAD